MIREKLPVHKSQVNLVNDLHHFKPEKFGPVCHTGIRDVFVDPEK